MSAARVVEMTGGRRRPFAEYPHQPAVLQVERQACKAEPGDVRVENAIDRVEDRRPLDLHTHFTAGLD